MHCFWDTYSTSFEKFVFCNALQKLEYSKSSGYNSKTLRYEVFRYVSFNEGIANLKQLVEVGANFLILNGLPCRLLHFRFLIEF